MDKGIKLSDYITKNNITLTEQEIEILLVKVLGIATDICNEEKPMSKRSDVNVRNDNK